MDRFLTLVDYMMVSMLQMVLTKIFDELLGIIKAHEMFYPDDCQLHAMCIDKQLEANRPLGSLESPLLLIEIVLGEKSIDVCPSR